MKTARPSVWKLIAMVVAWAVAMFLILPMFITFPLSLTPDRFLTMPHGEYSLRHYRTLFTDPIWLGAIKDSVVVALGAAVLASVTGSAAAVGLWQMEGKLASRLSSLPLLPLLVPPIVSALALSRVAQWFALLDTYTALIVGHAIVGLPFVFMTVAASLESVDKRILQAARSLGSGPLKSAWDVVVPNIRVGLITGFIFAFFTSWDEAVLALFLSARHVYTLPRKIWSDLRDNIDPAVAAASSLMIVVTIAIASIYLLMQARRNKAVSQAATK